MALIRIFDLRSVWELLLSQKVCQPARQSASQPKPASQSAKASQPASQPARQTQGEPAQAGCLTVSLEA